MNARDAHGSVMRKKLKRRAENFSVPPEPLSQNRLQITQNGPQMEEKYLLNFSGMKR